MPQEMSKKILVVDDSEVIRNRLCSLLSGIDNVDVVGQASNTSEGYELYDTFKPDIIHAQHLWVTPYAAKKTGVKYIVTAHGTDLKGFVKDERYHKYAIEGARGASKIITISNQVDRETKELYGIDDSMTELILNGYDSELFLVKDVAIFFLFMALLFLANSISLRSGFLSIFSSVF